MAEVESSPKTYGIAFTELSVDVMQKVVEIYEETIGGTSGTKQYKEQLVYGIEREISDLEDRGFTDTRLGSKLTEHSKLTIRQSYGKSDVAYFTFNPNLNPQKSTEKEKQTADELRKHFSSKVSEYLHSSGIGVEL